MFAHSLSFSLNQLLSAGENSKNIRVIFKWQNAKLSTEHFFTVGWEGINVINPKWDAVGGGDGTGV